MQYQGQFERPAGLIYDVFDATAHQVPRFTIPKDWRRYLGLDFGEVNMAGVFLAEEPDTRRLYVYRTYHRGGLSVAGHVRQLKHSELGIPFTVGGSKSEGEWRKEFRAHGLAVREPKLRDVELGIDRVYGTIQRGELYVFDDLAEYLEELTTYSRVVNERGEPTEEIEDKEDYHLLDATRYVLGYIRDTSRMQQQQQILIPGRDPLLDMDHSGF